jgi:hypothetical protein
MELEIGLGLGLGLGLDERRSLGFEAGYWLRKERIRGSAT